MQQKTNEAMHKIANAESDEEACARFNRLIKMIKPKSFKDVNEKYVKLCKD